MVIFINGSFGIGKTTVARVLRERLPHSTIFDPEPIGIALLKLTSLRPSARVDDFQDLRLWSSVSVRAIGLIRSVRQIVIVPMAFSNVSYLQRFLSYMRSRDSATFHFCLTAPLAVVRERLAAREVHGASAWQLRRSEECCAEHQAPEFAEHIATEGRSPQEVADEIVARLGLPSAG